MDAQKYGYLTVGGTVCTCIRFCKQTDMLPLPPVLGEDSLEQKKCKFSSSQDLKVIKWPPEFAGQILRFKIYTYTLKTLKMVGIGTI